MHAIAVDGLRKSYGAVEALRGVSFVVEPGEVVAILGPNGAGKTSLLEILEGYRTADSGSVSVLGFDPASSSPILKQQVGIVLQETAVDRFLTCREALEMYAEYYPQPRSVDDILDLVGLNEKAGSSVRTLSGGQQRRLDVGLGLIGNPRLLFLDEPTTGFDPSARRQTWQIIRDFASSGRTVVLTTHYLDEAQYLADWVIVVAAGEVVAEGAPEAIGGRAGHASRIRFRLPPGGLENLVGVSAVVHDNGWVEVETPDTTRMVHRVTRWALARGIVLEDLSVDRPSLEEVYLELIGEGDKVGGETW